MLTPTPALIQIATTADDPLRILIVGAGVAGVTIAQLLRRHGLHPTLVERAGADADEGYMLALMPMTDPVIAELEGRDRYLAASVALGRYGLRAHTGRLVREDSLARIVGRFGDYRGISRGQLLSVLSADGGTVSYDTSVRRLSDSGKETVATLRSGNEEFEAGFDLVIAADGIHSTTRYLVLHRDQVSVVDTGWGGWVIWLEPDAATDLGEELWGEDFFVGSYPVRNGLGVFVGGARADTEAGPTRFAAHIRTSLTTCDSRIARILDTLATSRNPYYWPLTDCRAKRWSTGRVVLLGDAAAGFLPTAGIGAGMAMESAGVLARTLRGATARDVPELLRIYEENQRPRVEAAQDTSRRLARLMFRQSKVFATLRDLAMSKVSVEAALGPIKKLLADSPLPTAPTGSHE
ncbi:FAD-dependent oxidoreductase [Amycolatopsis palatopharyngis]|uniref:FAD-dependent oxidoreductase n=1 Tax=Amycolatopsis palatopharyngis TaxID=187982 RepID=UPI000E257A13|nr:NAD(P)/FAD-dependent oxidoreductase [Amycolatopsis palatopharyngis]